MREEVSSGVFMGLHGVRMKYVWDVSKFCGVSVQLACRGLF